MGYGVTVTHDTLTVVFQIRVLIPQPTYYISRWCVLKVEDAAQRLEMNPQTLRLALQQGLLPFGIAVKTSSNRYTYKIFPMRLERYLKGDDVYAPISKYHNSDDYDRNGVCYSNYS